MHFIEIIINQYMSCIPWLSPVFTCIRQTIKFSSSHALLYSFLVFKYVTFILRKEKYVLGRENWLIFLGIWGEAELFLRICGAKAKYFLRSRGNYFQGFGEINALFSGIKGAQTPPPVGPCLCIALQL